MRRVGLSRVSRSSPSRKNQSRKNRSRKKRNPDRSFVANETRRNVIAQIKRVRPRVAKSVPRRKVNAGKIGPRNPSK